jgi:hypothetical protein
MNGEKRQFSYASFGGQGEAMPRTWAAAKRSRPPDIPASFHYAATSPASLHYAATSQSGFYRIASQAASEAMPHPWAVAKRSRPPDISRGSTPPTSITWAAAKRSRPPDISRGSTVLPPAARRIVRAGRVLQGASEGVYDCTRPSEQRRKARDAPRDKRGD